MIHWPQVVSAWDTPDFQATFIASLQALDISALPLQQALAHSSHVSDSPRTVMILDSSATAELIRVKTGIFYAGVIAGSCCADDPTPLCEQTEYCELQVEIDRQTAVMQASLLS